MNEWHNHLGRDGTFHNPGCLWKVIVAWTLKSVRVRSLTCLNPHKQSCGDLGDLDVGTADARSVPRIQGEYVYWQVMSMVVFVACEFKRLDKIRGTRDALELKWITGNHFLLFPNVYGKTTLSCKELFTAYNTIVAVNRGGADSEQSASVVCHSVLCGASHLFLDFSADPVSLQDLLRRAPSIAACYSHCLWQNHSCSLRLASGRAWLGSLCGSKYKTNTIQPHSWARGDELQAPSLLGPLAHVSWYKRSICVEVAPWVPPAMNQWSYSFFRCTYHFFLSDPCFGAILLQSNSKFYALSFFIS